MSERVGSGGDGQPVVDTAPLEAVNRMLTGDQAGVGFKLGDDGAVDFAVGKLDEQGQVVGEHNAASMTMLDTSKDVRSEVRDQAAGASARDGKTSKLRAFARRIGISVPIVAAVATAEKIPGVAGAFTYLSRVANRVIDNVATRSMEKKLIQSRNKNTSERYKDTLLRIEQDIDIDGDRITLLNDGETRSEARNDVERDFEDSIRQKIMNYWDNSSTILSPSDANPAEQRALLEQEITAAVEVYNNQVNKSDASRGMFTANNFLQFADAGKNALAAGAQLANVRAGFNKQTMIFAEAASPVPEQRVGKIEQFAQKVHNLTGGILSVDTAGVVATAVAGIAAGSGQFGAMTASRSIPIPGLRAAVSATTAGAFATVAEINRTNRERGQAARQMAYGEGGRVSDEMKSALMETKKITDVTGELNTQVDTLIAAMAERRGGLTPEEIHSSLNMLADFDQRVQAQLESRTPLFAGSSREAYDGEFWQMKKSRSRLQDVLARAKVVALSAETRRAIRPGTEEYNEAMAAARGEVRAELDDYLSQYNGSEKQALDQERAEVDAVFKKLRRNRAAMTGVKTALMVGFAASAHPLAKHFFGPGTTMAKVASTAAMGAVFAPGVVNEMKQMEQAAHAGHESEEADRQALNERHRLYGAKEGTAQVDGARPPEAPVAGPSASESAGETASTSTNEATAENTTDATTSTQESEAATNPTETAANAAEAARMARKLELFKQKFAAKYPNAAPPSDEDLTTMFNRAVQSISGQAA